MSVTELFDKAAAGKRVDRVTIRRPDDFHVHLRDGALLQAVLPFTAAQFARAAMRCRSVRASSVPARQRRSSASRRVKSCRPGV